MSSTDSTQCTARLLVRPISRLGLEQWHALVLGDGDAVLHRVVRWSESGARADAARWAGLQGWNVEEI